jgi:hypothetical protein
MKEEEKLCTCTFSCKTCVHVLVVTCICDTYINIYMFRTYMYIGENVKVKDQGSSRRKNSAKSGGIMEQAINNVQANLQSMHSELDTK